MYNWNNQVDSRRCETQSHFKGTINTFYSQYSQDRSLETCIFKGYKNGTFMDIGAHDGVDLNNGKDQLCYTKRTIKKPITKSVLLNILSKYYEKDTTKALEVNTFIFENREEVIKETIQLKKFK